MTDAITAFAKAQGEMGVALKKSNNPFFKSKYADLTAVQNAVFPAFHANGFMIYWKGDADEHGQFQECVAAHVSGQSFSSKCYLQFKQGDMQSLGGAITYARRYTLCSLTGVPVEDDDGNAATGRGQQQNKQNGPNAQDVVGAAMKLAFALPSLTADQMVKSEEKATKVIADLKEVDADFAKKLAFQWDNRKLELGIEQ